MADEFIQSFTLTSTGTGTFPFTVGLVFAKGDATAAHLDLATSQLKIMRTWNDGSIKHAIASGRATLTANVPLTITVDKDAASEGAALTASDIQSAAPTASVQCGALGTVSLASLLASPFRTWISGPEMVECHYQAAVGHGELSVWFHVRLYADDRVWIRAIVENGYVNDATADETYIPTITIGGVSVYTHGGTNLTHYAHTRYMAEGWIGGDPAVTPKHDPTYLGSTKLVPYYWKRSPSATALNALVQTYTPMDNGALTENMGGTGFQEQIGLLPLWDALYATSGDARAFRSMCANSGHLNSYPIVFRDSVSSLPPKPSEYDDFTLASDALGAGAYTWERSHHPSEGYLAYLMTGDYWHYETALLQAAMLYVMQTYAYGGGYGTSRLMRGQTRHVAWALRTFSQAVACAPTGDAVAAEYATLLSNNIAALDTVRQSLDGVGIGYLYEYDIDLYAEGTIAPWQQHFFIQSVGMGAEIEPLANMTTFTAVRDWLCRGVVGILGGNTGYCFAYASNYNITIANASATTDPSTWYPTWAQVYSATYGGSPPAYTTTLQGTSGGAPSSAPTGYWGNLLPAIAYAVDAGVSGAAAACARLVSATNWATVETSGFDDVPIWGIVPRFGNMTTLGVVAGAMAVGTWAEVTQTNMDAVIGVGGSTGNKMPYAMSAQWNPLTQVLHFVGSDHGDGVTSHFTYTTLTNTWLKLINDIGTTATHGYDFTTINPSTGTLYNREYYSQDIFRFTGSSWALLTSWPDGYGYVGIGAAVDWWSGTLTGGGAAGTLLVYNCAATNGEVHFYNPTTNAWFGTVTGFGGTSTYHGFIEYSPILNLAILGGGNDNARMVRRLNADRTVTAMSNAPMDLGIQRANVTVDPVTGLFLIMGSGSLYTYDPRGSGTWTLQTGARDVPAAVGNPMSPDLDSVASAPISTFGVVMYCTAINHTCNMYLYKHAASSDTPPIGTITLSVR